MPTIEHKLKPADQDGRSARGDLVVLALLAVLSLSLLPGWAGDRETFFENIIPQMLSASLLPAMGFLLVLRAGGIDLGVWMNFALGSAVAAVMIRADIWPLWAILAAGGAGLVVGAANALVVHFSGLRVLIVSLALAAIVWAGLAYATHGQAITLPAEAWMDWHLEKTINAEHALGSDQADGQAESFTYIAPLTVTRMLMVAGLYSLTMLSLLGLQYASSRKGPDAPALHGQDAAGAPGGSTPAGSMQLMAALCASGMLSGLGGACQLIDTFRAAPVPTIIGDLRIPAAALLAGGSLLAGPGRTLLAGLLLPLGVLLATVWRYRAWYVHLEGYDLQVLFLIAGLAIIMLSASKAFKARGALRTILMCATVAGIVSLLITAEAGRFQQHQIRDVMNIFAGILLTASAVLTMLASRRYGVRRH